MVIFQCANCIPEADISLLKLGGRCTTSPNFGAVEGAAGVETFEALARRLSFSARARSWRWDPPYEGRFWENHPKIGGCGNVALPCLMTGGCLMREQRCLKTGYPQNPIISSPKTMTGR